jgi:zinc transporter ZupT
MLSLPIGVLLFLLFNIIAKALEIIATNSGVFGGAPLVLLVALLTFGVLIAAGSGSEGVEIPTLDVAYRIALGIGLHNLGVGLAIRAVFALDEAALGMFLVVGLTLHNLTEGARIAAAIAPDRRSWWYFVLLAALAGLPAALGIWIFGSAEDTLFAALFLALGAGAIAQAAYKIGWRIARQSQDDGAPRISLATIGGLVAGIAIMYVTALLIKA